MSKAEALQHTLPAAEFDPVDSVNEMSVDQQPSQIGEVENFVLDALQALKVHAGKIPLLTPAEEIDLAKRIERGDLDAKDRMVNSNLRLLVSVARKYEGFGLDAEDLVQEGSMGLIRASEKFDYRKGFRFSTYATIWIRQAIDTALKDKGRTIRLPRGVEGEIRKVEKTERSLTVTLGREPTTEEIAKASGFDHERVLALKDMPKTSASLDQPVGDESDAAALGEMIADKASGPDQVIESIDRQDTMAQIDKALSDTDPRVRAVIEMRYGISGESKSTYAEIAKKLGVSTTRVQQIEKAAIHYLQDHIIFGGDTFFKRQLPVA